jgi:transcriptional regulator with XRE-family HTH domain
MNDAKANTDPGLAGLRSWRQGQGLSLRDVETLTGVSASMVSRAERGLRRMRLATCLQLARGLGVPITTLVGGTPKDEQ